jgi:hypothetical protein
MATETKEGAPASVPEVTPSQLNEAVGKIIKVIDGLPGLSQRRALLGAASLLGLDLRTGAAPAQRQSQQTRR